MKSLKKIIIALIILTIIITTILIVNNRPKENKSTSVTNTIAKEKINVEPVTSATAYFTVQSCANKYINYLQEEDKDSLYKLLDYEYIEKNSISENNILNKIKRLNNYEGSLVFEADRMYVEEIDDNNNLYYAKGILKEENSEEANVVKNEFYIAIKLEFENMIFSVIPLEDGGVFDEANN